MHKLFILFAFILFQQIPLFAQENNLNDSISPNEYVVAYSDALALNIYGISKFSNFELKEAGQKSDSLLKYGPNSNFNIGAAFNYKWLGFGAAFNFGIVNNDEKLKGKTTSLDLQLDIYAKRMIFNSNFQFYQGYYWKNPEVFIPDWNIKDSLVIRPDISTITLGLKGIYVFNYDKFSFKAAYQYTEGQLRSAGSMLLGSRFSIYGISADSSIVPLQLNEFYSNSRNIGSLNSISFGASFGYTYTLVLGKYFFVNALLMTGLNVQTLGAKDLYDEEIGSDIKLSTNVTFRIAMGVNKGSNEKVVE
jgi:hypothetical protein